MEYDLGNPAMRQLLVPGDAMPVAGPQTYPAQAWSRIPDDVPSQDTLAINPDPQNAQTSRAHGKPNLAGEAIRLDGEGQPCRLMTRRRQLHLLCPNIPGASRGTRGGGSAPS